MISDKVITNKIYMYAGSLHKVKRVQKKNGKVVLSSMKDSSEVVVPLAGSDLLLSRVYTIGEVAKIVERRPDTIRKYERSGLIPKPVAVGEEYPSYKNWRFYSHPDVYEIVDFFSNRTPGRPVKRVESIESVDNRIQNLNQKVKMTARSIQNARI